MSDMMQQQQPQQHQQEEQQQVVTANSTNAGSMPSNTNIMPAGGGFVTTTTTAVHAPVVNPPVAAGRRPSKFAEGRLKLSTSCTECHRRKQKVCSICIWFWYYLPSVVLHTYPVVLLWAMAEGVSF